MNNKKFKDECDKCHNMRECKGYQSLVLCNDCLEEEKNKNIETIFDDDNQVKFDFK